MEVSKAEWDTLFEPFSFFEAYKNYLQIDINAENEDDLRQWKGWVESRLRQLTLKVKHQLLFLFGYVHLSFWFDPLFISNGNLLM
jgi:poly(A) polymerase Pap1